jgi:hypothetical protein
MTSANRGFEQDPRLEKDSSREKDWMLDTDSGFRDGSGGQLQRGSQ